MSRARRTLSIRRSLPLALALTAAVACNSKHPAGGPQAGMGGRAIPVRVKTVESRPVGEFTEYLATLISRDSSVLQPDVDGQVTRIFVHPGEHVKRGQSLLEINPLKQQATVQSTQANQNAREADLVLAQQNLQRNEKLFHDGIVSQQVLQQAQAQYNAALANANANRASIAEQQAQLHYYTVRAPADGIVGDIPVHVGDRVTASTQLTSVVGSGALEAYIYVPAEVASQAKAGLKIAITADDNRPPVDTTVNFVSPRVDPQSQLLLLKAPVPNPNGRFRNDEEVHARVYWRQVNAPLIPVTSISRLGSQAFAFVVSSDNGKEVVHQVPIQLGQVVGNDYVVLSGIKSGDRIVVSDTQMLIDGMPVQATEAASSNTAVSGEPAFGSLGWS